MTTSSVRRWTQQDDLRLAAVNACGGHCACCDDSTFDFLDVYLTGELTITNRSRVRLYRAALTAGSFRVLCWNCCMALRRYGTCPHTATGSIDVASIHQARIDHASRALVEDQQSRRDVYVLIVRAVVTAYRRYQDQNQYSVSLPNVMAELPSQQFRPQHVGSILRSLHFVLKYRGGYTQIIMTQLLARSLETSLMNGGTLDAGELVRRHSSSSTTSAPPSPSSTTSASLSTSSSPLVQRTAVTVRDVNPVTVNHDRVEYVRIFRDACRTVHHQVVIQNRDRVTFTRIRDAMIQHPRIAAGLTDRSSLLASARMLGLTVHGYAIMRDDVFREFISGA